MVDNDISSLDVVDGVQVSLRTSTIVERNHHIFLSCSFYLRKLDQAYPDPRYTHLGCEMRSSSLLGIQSGETGK